MSAPVTLVGDVGGTNCRFAMAEKTEQGTIELHGGQVYPVADYATFSDAMRAYLDATGYQAQAAAFAFAGPKKDGVVKMTNANWTVSESALKEQFGLDSLVILNDFVAMANGARIIPDDGFQTIIPGKVNYNLPVAVMGPGTGMGVAGIIPGRPVRILATEGGHTAFAPQSKLEIKVLKYLQGEQGFVSAENLLSGPGLFRLYQSLCAIKDKKCKLTAPNEVVAAAEAGPDSLARKTVMMFCAMLGGFAGNTALTLGAFGGVVLGGGVSRHIAQFLPESDFTARFLDHGPGGRFLQGVPVRLIQAHFVPLYGAAAMILE